MKPVKAASPRAARQPLVADVKAVEGTATALLGDTAVILWAAPAYADGHTWCMRRCHDVVAKYPDGILFLDSILPTSSPPDAKLRPLVQSDMRKLSEKSRRMVVVPLGDSFWMSVVRTFARGVVLFNGQSKQLGVQSTVREGIDEILAHAGPNSPTRGELNAAVDALCDLLRVERVPT